MLVKFIQWLGTAGISTDFLHIIGFSLGAEAAGMAGKYLGDNGMHIGRITGNIFENKLM